MGTGGIRKEAWNERVLKKMTESEGHFRGKVETQCNGNSLESTRVTLSNTPSNVGHRV